MKGSHYQAIISPTSGSEPACEDCIWPYLDGKERSQGTSQRPLSLENLPVSLKRCPQRPDNGLMMRDRIDVGTAGRDNVSQRARHNRAGDDLDHTSLQLPFKESWCNHGAAAGS